MIRLDKIVTVILAGGKGDRLMPLTRDRAKPAVPFGGMYRIIDMTLSNCVNSGLRKILVLTQYMSRSLNSHLNEAWHFITRPYLGEFIEPIAPIQSVGGTWYTGTAAALHQNMSSILQTNPNVVLVLAGDHIYKMDYRHMLETLEETGADMVVGSVELPAGECRHFGVFEVDDQFRVKGFHEKSSTPPSIPGRSGVCLASMGIYAIRPQPMLDAFTADAADPQSSHDIGRNIVHRMIQNGSVVVCPFVDENKKNFQYWRDIGTLDAYYEAQMDLISVDPLFNLYDKSWPIFTRPVQEPPPKFVFSQEGPGGRMGVATDSLVCNGSVISGSRVRNSIIGPSVRIHSYAEVRESIIFEGVEIGRHARIQRAIIDKFVHVPEGMSIGFDAEQDRKRFSVSPNGIVVIPKWMELK